MRTKRVNENLVVKRCEDCPHREAPLPEGCYGVCALARFLGSDDLFISFNVEIPDLCPLPDERGELYYEPSRDENGDWLPVFHGIQVNASMLFDEMLKLHPGLHPYDIATAIGSIVDYDAVCVHRRNKRRERL